MAHSHSKKNRFLALLLFIITLPFVILGLLVFGIIYIITTVIPAPIEMLIYKSSYYYKELGFKYTLGITGGFGYKSYKHVRKNKAITFVRQEKGYYYYKTENAVLVIPYYESYFLENNTWMIKMDDTKQALDIANLRAVFEPLIKEDISQKEIKLLVKEKHFKKEELSKAMENPVFVFYKKCKDFADMKI